jgi:hypothetical protein
MRDLLRQTLAEKGLLELYRRSGLHAVRSGMYNGLYFGLYDRLGQRDGSLLKQLPLAWACTFGARLVALPFEHLVNDRLWNARVSHPHQPPATWSARTALRRIIEREGVLGLFRGASRLVSISLNGAGMLVLFAQLQSRWIGMPEGAV